MRWDEMQCHVMHVQLRCRCRAHVSLHLAAETAYDCTAALPINLCISDLLRQDPRTLLSSRALGRILDIRNQLLLLALHAVEVGVNMPLQMDRVMLAEGSGGRFMAEGCNVGCSAPHGMQLQHSSAGHITGRNPGLRTTCSRLISRAASLATFFGSGCLNIV